jgi:hypothetical protein
LCLYRATVFLKSTLKTAEVTQLTNISIDTDTHNSGLRLHAAHVSGPSHFALCRANHRAMTKTDRLLAAYERSALRSLASDKWAQDLYQISEVPVNLFANVRARHPKTTSQWGEVWNRSQRDTDVDSGDCAESGVPLCREHSMKHSLRSV